MDLAYVGDDKVAVVTVSGTRDATEEEHSKIIEDGIVRTVRSISIPAQYPIKVVQGGATGVDLIANRIAAQYHWLRNTVPAKWDLCGLGCPPRPHRRVRSNGTEYCPVAGPRRNTEMLVRYPPLAVVAFPAFDPESPLPMREQSKGTWDMIEQSLKGGFWVTVIPLLVQRQPALLPR